MSKKRKDGAQQYQGQPGQGQDQPIQPQGGGSGQGSPSKQKPKNLTKTIVIVAIVVVVAVAGGLIARQLMPQGSTGSSVASGSSASDNDPVVAEATLPEQLQGSQVISVTPANESPNIETEDQVAQVLSARGFDGKTATTDYDMDGNLQDTTQISGGSSEHPTYDLEYISSSGDLWTIMVYNGQVMANPVTYNVNSSNSVQTIISESQSVTSYDGETNTFYLTIPTSSQLIVKTVPQIDAKTLDSLTSEGIDAL